MGQSFFVLLRLHRQQMGDVLTFDQNGSLLDLKRGERMTGERLEGMELIGNRVGLHELPTVALTAIFAAIQDLCAIERRGSLERD